MSTDPELPPVAPRGADTETAAREWLKDEIKGTSKTVTDLGKYFFATSTASVGLLKTLSEIGGNTWTGLEWAAVMLFIASALLGLWMVLPPLHQLDARFDILAALRRRAVGAYRAAIAWAFLWSFGVLLAGVGLFSNPAEEKPKGILGALGSIADRLGAMF